MTSLICLIQAANLKDGRRMGENQPFETDEEEAEILIRGGIAKPAPAPVKEAAPAPVVEAVPEPSPKKITSSRKR